MADRLDSERLRGFDFRLTDRLTDGQTDICNCRVAFTTEKVLGPIIVCNKGYWITSDTLGCVIFSDILKFLENLVFWVIRGLARKRKMLQVSNFGAIHPWTVPNHRGKKISNFFISLRKMQ